MSVSLFPTGLQGIIYDCDGVMISSRAANTRFYNRVLAFFGMPPMSEEQEHYTYMATGMQSLYHILPEQLHPKIHEVITTKVFYADVVPYLTLMPDFSAFVSAIHAKGLKQAMCTNRTQAGFEEILSFFHFPRYFDPIMTVSCVRPKPSPDGVIAICQAWQCDPKAVLFIGDSVYDREAAYGGQVRFAAFNAIDCQGDLTVSTYPELYAQLFPDSPALGGEKTGIS